MKKIVTVLGITAASLAYSQGMFMLNNYSPHDFHGNLMAMNLNGCVPAVMNNDPASIIVPANSHMGNGLAWKIDNYRDQFSTSIYPVTNWIVTLGPSPSTIRLWNNPSLMPGGVIANNTKWTTSKFQMYYAGTGNHVVGFNTSLGNATPNSCITSVDYFSTPNGSAEWFTITGTDTITYFQIYP
ncbi:hypothetical protein B0A69_05455 [Chryseobacterium shigense]|uniref:Uncharacterized protein n=1 Tax=Chryseobacterium shigense TaxID=297244 RepID=A0A1N7ILB2_9FLAO|nr:hypothetical protein [Chryseobacterium shigense]PQA95816.1 hypothetical protein B0A69_05455 [Chryseobacterium shigense]SIS37864.1 hypothetical protein SAMN05421639_104174 [Chryseobacterium shigense]